MASAVAAARRKMREQATEGDLQGRPALVDVSNLDDYDGEPIVMPDGKTIYPPKLFGEPLHRVAANLIDLEQPATSRFIRLVGPPGVGKSQVARGIALELWRRRGRDIEQRNGHPFYGFVEVTGGPSSDEFLFRYDYVPEDGGTVRVVDAAFVEAMRNGWVVMIDEVNTIRESALLSLNSTLDGRLSLYLASTGETVIAQPGFAVIIAYNPGLVGATDIPDAWRSRFPATIEVTSNWGAMRRLGIPVQLIAAAAELDKERRGVPLAGQSIQTNVTGLTWTPQFRDIEALADMMDRVGERAAVSMFISNIAEQVDTGRLLAAELEAVERMLDTAGYAHYRTAGAYPRALAL
jgi:hypothetical protein